MTSIIELKAALDLVVDEDDYRRLAAELARLEMAETLKANKERAEAAASRERVRAEARKQYTGAIKRLAASRKAADNLDREIFDLAVRLVEKADECLAACLAAGRARDEAAELARQFDFEPPAAPPPGIFGMPDLDAQGALGLYVEHLDQRNEQVAHGREMPPLDLERIKTVCSAWWRIHGAEQAEK